MNQVYVALREGDGDAGGGEGIVDDLLNQRDGLVIF